MDGVQLYPYRFSDWSFIIEKQDGVVIKEHKFKDQTCIYYLYDSEFLTSQALVLKFLKEKWQYLLHEVVVKIGVIHVK